MEKLYYYFKDANIEKVKELISQCELRNCNEDSELEYKTLTDKKYIDEIVKRYFNDKNFKFTFCLSKQEVLQDDVLHKINNLVNELTLNGIKKENIVFTVLDYTHDFSKEQWEKIIKVNTKLKNQNITFGFEDHGKTWDIRKVKSANNQLKKTANILNRKKLSPFEKILCAYIEVTSREYIEENPDEHFAISRSVYGTLNSDKIVCVGYSEWLAAILDLTKDENIRVYQNGVQLSEDNITSIGGHRTLVVYIKDEKYNLNGYYYLDPTWDSTFNQNITEFNLNNFLLPLNDISEYIKYVRADFMFLDLPESEDEQSEFEYILDENNKNDKLEYEYGTFLSDKHSAKFGQSDDNNNVSFSRDKFVYDGRFFNDFKKDYMHLNTLKDFNQIELNEKLDLLNDIIDRNKDILNNLKFIKSELKKHNVSTLTNKDLKNIAYSDNYINTVVDIICDNKKQNSKEYPLNTAMIKLQTKLQNQQKKLEKDVNEIMHEDFSKIFNEDIFNFYQLPVLDKTIKYLSTPITLNKIKHALKEYFINFTNLSNLEIEEQIKKIIEHNIYGAVSLQKETAQNAFTQEFNKSYDSFDVDRTEK